MSLYIIENEINAIFAEIEEAGGEMTPELEARLGISKENLKSKLDNYVKAIRNFESDIDAVDKEVKRLQSHAKVNQNKIDRLKKSMLEAVQAFGSDNPKSGNKFVDLPTIKLFTKATPSTVTNDNRIALLVKEFANIVSELVDNQILYTGSDVELLGILDIINANIKAYYENKDVDVLGMMVSEEFVPYSLLDLTTIKIQITTTKSIYDYFRTGKQALELYANDPITTKLSNATTKPDWKTAIDMANTFNGEGDETTVRKMNPPTVAEVVKNVSIQMK